MDLNIFELGEMHGKPAPSAPNIKHPVSRLQAKFAGDVIFFETLSIVQWCLRLRKIGTRVLHVIIKKEAVEIVADIIVMGHIAR